MQVKIITVTTLLHYHYMGIEFSENSINL